MQAYYRLGGFFLLSFALIVPTFAGDDKKNDAKEAKKDEKQKAKSVDDVGKNDPKDEKKNEKKDEKKKAKSIDDKGDDAKGKDEAKDPKFSAQYSISGKLTVRDANSQRDFTIQTTTKVKEPNQGAFNTLADQNRQLAQHQVNLARARNAQERNDRARDIANVRAAIARTQADLYRYKDVTRDWKLRATENVKVRWNFPPPDYDEKGNLKKWTKKELEALRGKTTLPGYPADFDAVRVGQLVTAYLPIPVAQPKGAKGKAKKVDDDETAVSDRQEVIILLIVQEAPAR